MRINISQAFNGIGTVVAPVLGSYVIFLKTGDDEQSLRNVQWIYLAIACFCFLLAAIFYFSPIPEITDADMEFQAEETHANTAVKPFWQQYRLFHATFAQFCYTGAQVAIAGYVTPFSSHDPSSIILQQLTDFCPATSSTTSPKSAQTQTAVSAPNSSPAHRAASH